MSQPHAISAADRADVSRALGHITNDVAVACNALAMLRAQHAAHMAVDGGAAQHVAATAFSIDAKHATYFVVRMRSLRVFSGADAEQLMQLTRRVFEVKVDFQRQRVAVYVSRAGGEPPSEAYAPPASRKRRRLTIDWAAGHVTDADDVQHLSDVVDDVYNYQDCMPDVSMFFDHIGQVGSATRQYAGREPAQYIAATAAAAGGGGGCDDGSESSALTSEQADEAARSACGFAVCFLGMPECKFGTFSAFLRKRYGSVVPLVYCSFGPPAPKPDASMLVVNVRKALADAGAPAARTLHAVKAPRPPIAGRSKRSKRQ